VHGGSPFRVSLTALRGGLMISASRLGVLKSISRKFWNLRHGAPTTRVIVPMLDPVGQNRSDGGKPLCGGRGARISRPTVSPRSLVTVLCRR
jgi:hypothetical protein